MHKRRVFLFHMSMSPFSARHIGPTKTQQEKMLLELGVDSLEDLIEKTIPKSIFEKSALTLKPALTESEALESLKKIAKKNKIFKSYLGMGYVGTETPTVILRNILENPGWYTQYTPYQAEISQGRLEALLNFQTMIIDMTGLEISNASLLDEATAAAEAMAMSFSIQSRPAAAKFFVASDCHPQTIAVVKTRAKYLGVAVIVEDPHRYKFDEELFGALFQYPNTIGEFGKEDELIQKAKNKGAIVTLSCDLMALALLKSPGELGADIAVGSAQSFGVPMGFGGPHAAFIATKDEHKRLLPGRIVGLSKDTFGRPAIRLALQTREQHIRRDKATSNICTAQVLLAIMASMYAVYHGPKGIQQIATKIQLRLKTILEELQNLGYEVPSYFFNTALVSFQGVTADQLIKKAEEAQINVRKIENSKISITVDESTTEADAKKLIDVFKSFSVQANHKNKIIGTPTNFLRATQYLTHPVFNSHHSETEMLRYIFKLQSRDLSLAQSMIPLGSCTMKLNATTEMLPVTWEEFSNIHPFAAENQTQGYREMIGALEEQLSEITGFDGVSLQPNAGSQGEYAGLLVIRKYHEYRGENNRDVCLIPMSAHGTNPASAAMAGLKVVVVLCDKEGNIDLKDLKNKAEQYKENLAALMITYPSTHGVFEEDVKNICEIIHANGGQVYMDGANMNAQVGLCKPAQIGADVCHLNLHKTFCIPHGGGGPGMGPIGVKKHLIPFLPNHPVVKCGGEQSVGAISAAPWGSASILSIPHLYILMMGADGLKKATQVAILSANYIAKKLSGYFPVLYRGKNGFVAHECIVDLRPIKESSGVEVEDVAKRLMDYGFHAPTVSFPVAGTIMIEPTESEPLAEIDRFILAMIKIREEISEVEKGQADRKNNVLKNAPHTARVLADENWSYPYSRKKAVFPAEWVQENKFWPSVSRIDGVYGDRNLVCSSTLR